MSRGSMSGSKGKKKGVTFTIDCSKPVEDKIMDIASLEKVFKREFKVGGKAGVLDTARRAKSPSPSDGEFSKRISFLQGRGWVFGGPV
ncbi:60S ribosomal protein L22-3 [Hibiscus syriacus]|uniref:Large ribosomal subunit protein eL22 n=1 Tax=Hibiscus syriacus TaxID=106335 RepID=A0A6A2XIQ1_HIBSY|nr:60S ribosomal protein L22-3 [Hibiscus syriacus]